MSGNSKKHSSWAEVAKAFDKAAAESAERRVAAPSKAISAPVMKTPPSDHLERLRARLAAHREQSSRSKIERGSG